MSQVWSLAKIWNKALEQINEKEVMPRDRIYASELGRSDIDIFLKMQGEKPTNPPNERSQRKFHAGDLYEWFVFLILKKCGVLISNQIAVKTTKDGCVEVSGRLDFIAGGTPNYDEGQMKIDQLIDELEMPPLFHTVTRNFIEILRNEYPDGLDEKVLEIKSVANFGFERVEKTGKAMAGHDLQNFHYSKGLDKEGALCYINREDLRMYEIPIMPYDQKLQARYDEKVERVSKFYLENQSPEPEPMILFDEDMGKFSKNFNVEYSPFLKKIYGIERPDQYDEEVSPIIGRWNRVLGRIKGNKKLTPDNELALEEMRNRGFDTVKICGIISKAPLVGEEVINGEEI
jgi:hypothetical protein